MSSWVMGPVCVRCTRTCNVHVYVEAFDPELDEVLAGLEE